MKKNIRLASQTLHLKVKVPMKEVYFLTPGPCLITCWHRVPWKSFETIQKYISNPWGKPGSMHKLDQWSSNMHWLHCPSFQELECLRRWHQHLRMDLQPLPLHVWWHIFRELCCSWRFLLHHVQCPKNVKYKIKHLPKAQRWKEWWF